MVTSINLLTEVFRNVLLTSIVSACVFALIVLIKILFGKKMTIRSHARIWIILVIFLVIPLPGMIGNIKVPENEITQLWLPVSSTVKRLDIEPVKGVNILQEDIRQTLAEAQPEEILVRAPGIALSKTNTIWLIVSLIWLLGSVVMLTLLFSRYIHTLNKIKKKGYPADTVLTAMLKQKMTGLRCRFPVDIAVTDEAEGPYIIGIFRYRIVMPSGMTKSLDAEQIGEILTHELMHLCHLDPLLRLLLCIVRSVRWFDPFCHIAIHNILKDHEYYCDEATVTASGSERTRSHYADTLLSAAAASKRKRRAGQLQTAKFIESGYKERIIRILNKRKTSLLVTIAAVMTVAITGCAILPGFIRTTPTDEPLPTPTIAPASTPTPKITMPASTPTAMPDPVIYDEMPDESILTELDFGGVKASGNEFYWSPYDHVCLFKGYRRRESDNESMADIYFWDTNTNKVSRLTDDTQSRISYSYLFEPSWSPDGTQVIFILYSSTDKDKKVSIYNIDSDTVDELPIANSYPRFSADGTKLIYIGDDSRIRIYDLQKNKITGPSADIEADEALLMSDNSHIVYCKKTTNEHGFEYTWKSEIAMVDKDSPGDKTVIASDIPLGGMKWLIQDKLIIISVIADEVLPKIVIDVQTHKVTELGYPEINIFNGWGHDMKIVADYIYPEDKKRILDDTLLKDMFLFTEGEIAENEVIGTISILPDDSILCLGGLYNETLESYLYLTDSSGKLNKKLMMLSGSLSSPVSSFDGKRVALFDYNTEKPYLLDVEKLYSYLDQR